MILVTGASGHIGNVLVRELLKNGEQVRVLVRKSSVNLALQGLKVEYCFGDLLDQASLNRACQGVDYVYHLAGYIHIGKADKKSSHINLQGTKNIVQACQANQVKRLIYTSSIHVFCERCSGACLTEKSEINSKKLKHSYDQTKAQATEYICQQVRAKKLDAVIVYPTAVIGPHDYKPSKLGQFMLDYVRGQITIRPEGSYDFVDVRDVVAGLIAAAKLGRSGEGYFLSGERLTIAEFMQELSQISGAKFPKIMSPLWLSGFVAQLAKIYYFFSKNEPLITPYAVKTLGEKFSINLEKSQRELGYQPRAIRQTIVDTLGWFKANKML